MQQENNKPEIYSLRKGADKPLPDAVYCGRGSVWGNPYVMGKDGSRDEVCDKFYMYALEVLKSNPKWLKPLVGKSLVCYCAPLRCHCEALRELANDGRYD